MRSSLRTRWSSFVKPTPELLSDVVYCIDAIAELKELIDLRHYRIDAIRQNQVVVVSKYASAQELVDNIRAICIKANQNEVIPADLLAYSTKSTALLGFVSGTLVAQINAISAAVAGADNFSRMYVQLACARHDAAEINAIRIRPTLRHLVTTLVPIAQYINER